MKWFLKFVGKAFLAGIVFSAGVSAYFYFWHKFTDHRENKQVVEFYNSQIDHRKIESSLPAIIEESTKVSIHKIIASDQGLYVLTKEKPTERQISNIKLAVATNSNFNREEVFVQPVINSDTIRSN
jgi:hypothetical protein